MANFNVTRKHQHINIAYGKNLYILGTSEYGPLLEPMRIESEMQLTSEYGRSGSLIGAYLEAYQTVGNSVNIHLVRISGEYASRPLFLTDIETSEVYQAIKFTSKNPGKQYDNCNYIVYEDYIELINPVSLGGESFKFPFKKHPTIGTLVRDINALTRAGRLHIWAESQHQGLPSSAIVESFEYNRNIGEVYQFGLGDDGINISKNELHSKLDLAYNILEGQPIDIICVADAYFDDVSPFSEYGDNEGYSKVFYNQNRDYLTKPHEDDPERTATFHGQLIRFCYAQLNSSIMTHGVMAFNPLETVEYLLETKSYLTKAVNTTAFSDRFDLITEQGDEIIDHGRFVSVVLGEFQYNTPNGTMYYGNGYIAYAAMLAKELSPKSTTNEIVPNCLGLRYHLEDDEAQALSQLGVVTFRKSIMKDAIVVRNGVTAERNESPYHYVSNVRMVQMTVAYMKVLMDNFIGQDVRELKASKTIDRAVEDSLESLKKSGIVRDITYTLTVTDSGVALLNLNILAIYAFEYVSATASTKL